MNKKMCTKCKLKKSLTDFYLIKSTKKHKSECKQCTRDGNLSFKKQNKDKIDQSNKKYRLRNKENIKQRNSQYLLENKDKKREYNKQYRLKNKENRNFKTRERKKNDPLFKMKHNISSLILKTFKQNNCKKNNKSTEILCCSMQEFKLYIEKQFEPWMNWQNHGKYDKNKQTWQLDHIKLISLAKNELEVIQLNHYTNFQPLESMENLLKYNKIK